MTYTVASLFSGIGGIDLGFKQAGFNIVYAVDENKYCQLTYEHNHMQPLTVQNIHFINADDLPDHDVLTAGFPCQPFSIAGYQKGFQDHRGMLFYQIIRILKELKTKNRISPVVFLENVKHLLRHNRGRTFNIIRGELEQLGYHVRYLVMNTCDYCDVPQNRERLYIVGFQSKRCADHFKFPVVEKCKVKVSNVIDWGLVVHPKYYYTLSKNVDVYNRLQCEVEKKYLIYQDRRVAVRCALNGLCPTLTANMGKGGRNTPYIRTEDNRIRKVTPLECLSLQGFPEWFVFPQSVSDTQAYIQIGNSVSVPVISKLAKEVWDVLEWEKHVPERKLMFSWENATCIM